MKSSQIDTELFNHTKKIHLKVKMMIITNTLRKILNFFNVNHLWNQIQTTEITEKNQLQSPESSYSEIFTGQLNNKTVTNQTIRSNDQNSYRRKKLQLFLPYKNFPWLH